MTWHRLVACLGLGILGGLLGGVLFPRAARGAVMSAPRPAPRIIGPASEVPWTDRRCTHCQKVLTGRVAWLELDQSSGKYHDRGDVAPEVSQGWFPFGLTCARAQAQ